MVASVSRMEAAPLSKEVTMYISRNVQRYGKGNAYTLSLLFLPLSASTKIYPSFPSLKAQFTIELLLLGRFQKV